LAAENLAIDRPILPRDAKKHSVLGLEPVVKKTVTRYRDPENNVSSVPRAGALVAPGTLCRPHHPLTIRQQAGARFAKSRSTGAKCPGLPSL